MEGHRTGHLRLGERLLRRPHHLRRRPQHACTCSRGAVESGRGGAGASHCMLGWQWLAGMRRDGSPCWGIIPGMKGGGMLGMPGIIMPFGIIMPGLGGMP